MFATKREHVERVKGSNPAIKQIVFSGRTKLDTKRQIARYWSMNQAHLGMGLSEFTRRCKMLDDRTIVVELSG